jgi:hypothetical protein
MKKLSCALAFFIALLLATPTFAQVDIAVTAVTPLSNIRLSMRTTEPVKVIVKNLSNTNAPEVKVKVTIRTYNSILIYADSTLLAGMPRNSTDTIELQPFEVTETSYYEVIANASIAGFDPNLENNRFSNPRVSHQADIAITSIVTPIENEQKLQKLSFPIKGRFKSTIIEANELDVRVRVEIRRCLDDVVAFQADAYIPELPLDTATVEFQFPTQQGIYDLRKLDAGCYKLIMMTRMTADFSTNNNQLSVGFSIQPNILPNDVMTDSVNAIKDKTIKPGEALPLSFMFGNMGKLVQPSTDVHVSIRNEINVEVYHEQATLTNWLVGESRTQAFPAFSELAGGTYTLRAYTALPGDEFRFNDTLTRKITVERAFTLKIDTILVPTPGQAIEVGSEFTSKALISWTGNAIPSGNIQAVLVMRSVDGKVALPFFANLSGFTDASGSREVLFPQPTGGSHFSELIRGDYTATAILLVEGKPIDTSSSVPFRMAYQHDVSLDSTISPVYYRSYPLGPVSIEQIAVNIGLAPESSVTLDAVITDSKGRMVYHEIVSHPLDVLEEKLILLPAFVPPGKGMYEASFQIDVPNETYKSDNTIFRHRFHVGHMYDAALDSSIDPRPDERKPFGKTFFPAVQYAWLGVDTVPAGSLVDLRILRCSDNSEIYRQTRSGSDVVVFSETSLDGTRLRDLSAGCYHAVFTANHPLDPDHSDDTLVVPFTVEEMSAVRNTSSESFVIERVYQIGNALRVDLKSGSLQPINYAIYNIRGEQVISGESSGDGAVISLAALPSGSYILQASQGTDVARQSFNYIK